MKRLRSGLSFVLIVIDMLKFSFHLTVSGVQPPGKFGSQGLEEIVLIEPDETECKGFAANGELHLFVHDLLAGFQHADEVFRAAFHLEGNDVIIRYYDRADVKVVRRHGRDDETGGIRENDGPVAA